jgi:HAD superfamily hydrolase (TIGR01509 family)
MIPLQVLLLDFDGVIRHFADDVAAIEAAHGLAPGALMAAFEPAGGADVTTGRLTHAEFAVRLGDAVGVPAAGQAWAYEVPFHADHEVLALAERARAAGVRVCLLTNGTDKVPQDLGKLGIVDRFDMVFNTHDIGWAKPSPEIYEHVLDRLDVPAQAVLFVDDAERNVRAAAVFGIDAVHFTGVTDLADALARRGAH